MDSRIGILGAGAQAREVRSYLPPDVDVFFAVSAGYRDLADPTQIDIGDPSPEQRNTPVLCAVGPPALRRNLIRDWPGTLYTSVISGFAYVDPTCAVGGGCVIAPGAVVTVDVRVGAHSHINVGATISHDVRLGDYVTVAPGAHIAGNATIGDGVFVGVGACVVNGITVAPGVVIGAGAIVVGDILTANAVVVGVPGKVTRVGSDWLERI